MAEELAPNLKETIAAAVKEHTEGEAPSTEVQSDKTESKVEDTPKPKTEEEKTEEAVELENAKQLYKALKDPGQRDGIIEYIAKQAGYSKVETKQEAVEAKKDITAILKDKLGDSFDFMTPQLAAAIKEYVSSELAEHTKDIRSKQEESEKEKLESQSAAALTKLGTSFFGEGQKIPDEVEKGMSKYMDQIPPSSDLSISDYLAHAFYATVGRLGLTKVNKADVTKSEKINKNRTDAAARLASDRSSTAVGQPVEDTSKLTRRQAIQAAMEQLNKDN